MNFGVYDPLEVVSRYEASFFEPDKTKESFKFAYQLFEEHASNQLLAKPTDTETDSARKLIDLGCATGEFLAYARHRSTQLQLVGVDASQRFIDIAKKKFNSDSRTNLMCSDILSVSKNLLDNFDGVTCLGTLSVFEDFRPVIDAMMGLLSPRGVAIFDGFFCPGDFEVDVVWRKTSEPYSGTSGVGGGLMERDGWRRGFKRFAKNSIINYLREKGYTPSFFDFEFFLDLPRVISEDMRAYTVKREGTKSRLLVNDLGQIVNSEFCVFTRVPQA